MKLLRFIFFPFAIIYGLITAIRNGFYSIGIFKASKFSIPIINVGNVSMGGTGKTPHTEYLIRLLKNNYNVVTLSRGFGRKERGYILADKTTATAEQIGDEPLQYLKKFGDEISVVVDANRVTGVMDTCRLLPETEVVLLDDAYQHRAIKPGLNILITPHDDPFYNDFILPVGNLREARAGKKRADIIVVSKCPPFEELNKEHILKKIKPKAHQTLFFSRVVYSEIFTIGEPTPIALSTNQNIILVTGIANPKPLVNHLKKTHQILHHFQYNDHHNFKASELTEIHNLFDKFATDKPVIVTTEKDAMRLLKPALFQQIKPYNWCFQSISIEIDNAEKFNQKITTYVEKNC